MGNISAFHQTEQSEVKGHLNRLNRAVPRKLLFVFKAVSLTDHLGRRHRGLQRSASQWCQLANTAEEWRPLHVATTTKKQRDKRSEQLASPLVAPTKCGFL